MKTLFSVLIVWNIIVFVLYGVDKRKAIHNEWRIKERTLILAAFGMGGTGAVLGMFLFRHKTKHFKFKILLPAALLFNASIIIYVLAAV